MTETNQKTHESTWNIIDETNFRERLNFVFQKVAKSLSNTLGPYGSTSIIEHFGEMHVTKDGWNVLKNIRFNDPVDNNLMALLLRISSQVVIQVGDGSTSSIVAANEILKIFEKEKTTLSSMRPKDLIQAIDLCVEEIVSRLYANSTKINDTDFDEIYRIAYVATNGDESIAKMIRDIYQKTNNPTIEYRESKTNDTVVDITNGYTLNNSSYLDSIFATNDSNECVITNPYVLMFDYKIDIENAISLISAAAEIARDNASRLVVIAPHYDKILLDYIRKTISAEYRSNHSTLCVYCRASLVNNMSHVLYNDFAVMAGADILHEQYDEDAAKLERENVADYLGKVEKIIIGDKSIMISGFTARNEAMYDKVISDAKFKYQSLEEDYKNRGIVDTAVTDAKNRLTKLSGNMGIINVGGSSTLEKKANFDLVEDAVRACESAYRYGYNIGGSLIIPFTIQDILNEYDMPTEKAALFHILCDAFMNVFRRVVENKYFDDSARVDEIVRMVKDNYGNAKKNGTPMGYDLVNDVFSDNVINSCRTDIEILRGAVSVITLLYTSNQYVSIVDSSQK